MAQIKTEGQRDSEKGSRRFTQKKTQITQIKERKAHTDCTDGTDKNRGTDRQRKGFPQIYAERNADLRRWIR